MSSKVNGSENTDKTDTYDFTESIPIKLRNALRQCIECGKCVGSCTAARVSDFNIREIVKNVINKDDSVLRGDNIWKCFLCNQCEMICPKKDMNLPELIQRLREIAIQRGYAPFKLKGLTNWLDRFFKQGKIAGPNQLGNKRLNELGEIAEKSGVNTLKKYVEKLKNNNGKTGDSL
ncbi:MAG: 4Fe-4S dicluster domain-containing protein [Promethearchaeota archaeon]